MRYDSKAATATSNHEMAFHSDYSTISKCGASKLQKMTKLMRYDVAKCWVSEQEGMRAHARLGFLRINCLFRT